MRRVEEEHDGDRDGKQDSRQRCRTLQDPHAIEKDGEPALLCEWNEFAGSPVTPRCRDGFGSMLLERVLPQQIRAEVTIDFAPGGFRLRMAVPLQNGR